MSLQNLTEWNLRVYVTRYLEEDDLYWKNSIFRECCYYDVHDGCSTIGKAITSEGDYNECVEALSAYLNTHNPELHSEIMEQLKEWRIKSIASEEDAMKSFSSIKDTILKHKEYYGETSEVLLRCKIRHYLKYGW